MSTTTAATAVAPQVNGKQVAVAAVIGATKAAHIGFTAMADIAMYAGAHLVNKIDKTITVQDTVDAINTNTNAKLEKLKLKLSGYKQAE